MDSDIPDLEIEALEGFIEEYMQLERGMQRPEDIFSILPGSREGKYQYTLQYFLDPNKPHGFGYTLLEAFLDCIDYHEFNLSGQHIEIEDEVGIVDDGAAGRIDLIISGGSSLSDHPQWAVFLELKVGAEEGQQQTTKYAETDRWSFNWFDSNELSVDKLEDNKYVYIKRDTAEAPSDSTGTFESVSWMDIIDSFETNLQEAVFDYPNRSVIQFTDFIQSLKETENMGSPINEDELNERLSLYYRYKDLIQQVEQANSQFESDFENLSSYLIDSWETKLFDKYDFDNSGWKTSPSSNPKWQGILPTYWDQDPLNQSSTIKLYFRHAPTTDTLRNQTLTFRLRLPPARNVHTNTQDSGKSFNDVFAEKCTSEYADRLDNAAAGLSVDTSRLGSASALVEKTYPLDPQNLANSYFDQLDTAVEEFCSSENELLVTINEIFETTYRDVFGKEPVGEFPGYLPVRE